MDELCEVFLDSIFLGELPKSHFVSHFRRAVRGSKIATSYTAKPGGAHNSRSNPDQLPRTAWDRPDSRDKQRHGYRPTISSMGRLRGFSIPGNPEPEPTARLEGLYHPTSYAEHLKKAKAAVLKDFEGPRPVMAVDYFSIYALCTKITSQLVALMKDGIQDLVDSDEEGSMPASCFLVDHLLESLTALTADRTSRVFMGKTGDLSLTARAFEVVDRELSLGQMKWKM